MFEDVRWCAGDGSRDGTDPPARHERFDGTPSDGLLPWCLVSEKFELQADGQVVQTQFYDGFGDPFYK